MKPKQHSSKKKYKNRTYCSSFYYAFQGIRTAFLEERNIRSHFMSAFIAIVAGFIFRLSAFEWAWLILAIWLVIILEIVNTVVENLVDFITEEYHPRAKKIKDMAAASVMMTSILAVLIGLIVFGRHIVQYIQSLM